MSGFKGIQNKDGRPTGTPNKNTTKVRESFAILLENNIDKMQSDLDSLKPKERLDTIINLASFIVPKLRAIEVTDTAEREQPKILIDMSLWK